VKILVGFITGIGKLSVGMGIFTTASCGMTFEHVCTANDKRGELVNFQTIYIRSTYLLD
jgi:hypothetical protein